MCSLIKEKKNVKKYLKDGNEAIDKISWKTLNNHVSQVMLDKAHRRT